jgi:hypothetical protein
LNTARPAICPTSIRSTRPEIFNFSPASVISCGDRVEMLAVASLMENLRAPG